MPEKQGEKRRKILRVLIGILLVMIAAILIAVICLLHFGKNQRQHMMQEIVSAKVIKHEEKLLEIVKNLDEDEMLSSYEDDEDDEDYSILTKIYYKDLEDENVNRMFRTFNLVTVSKISGDGSVSFSIDPVSNFSFLWSDYDYGFYYTENDEPVNVVWTNEIEETEFEYTIEDFGRYYYRTEKITDNWWYYETKWLWFYP
ncbi:MAG: hypothetical protein HDR30_07790 [Lachnospiraceae bacterium]|nr:hypothetical protein [Lachnospiraceae bacterium]